MRSVDCAILEWRDAKYPNGRRRRFFCTTDRVFQQARQILWSVDVLLVVLIYTALLLLIPTSSPQWRERQ